MPVLSFHFHLHAPQLALDHVPLLGDDTGGKEDDGDDPERESDDQRIDRDLAQQDSDYSEDEEGDRKQRAYHGESPDVAHRIGEQAK